MRVSALIVNYNSGEYTVNCIRSLRREEGGGLEVEPVVVDNASPRDQAPFRAEAARLGARWLDHGWNAGYAAGVNRAFRECTGELILTVNPDVELLPGALGRLAAAALEPGVGAAGPLTYWDVNRQIRFPPNVLPTRGDALSQALAHLWPGWNRRYAGRRTRAALRIWLSPDDLDVPTLSGGCVLSRRDVWLEVGEMDERYPLYFEDTDWFLRVRAGGLRLRQVQRAEVAHFFNRSGVTSGGEAMARYWVSRRRFFAKHYGRTGEIVAEATRRLVLSPRARRRLARPMDRIRDLGRHREPFTLDLPRACDRFLLELTQDPGFFLAGAIFGRGASWSPGPLGWPIFGPSGYFLRGFDLSGRAPRYLGTWYFERV